MAIGRRPEGRQEELFVATGDIRRLSLEAHEAVFAWVLQRLRSSGLLSGKTLGVDSTTLEANAALRSIVRRDDGSGYEEWLEELARASGIDTPTRADLAKLDRKRPRKGSNEDWVHPDDPEARITKMKDGRTHLAHKLEQAAGPKGDIIFRWGNPGLYDSGEVPTYNADGNVSSEGDRMLFHHHDTQWIKEGLPGAGNFLIFENGSRRAGPHRSEILEVNPYAGSYPDAPYLSEVAAGGSGETPDHALSHENRAVSGQGFADL